MFLKKYKLILKNINSSAAYLPVVYFTHFTFYYFIFYCAYFCSLLYLMVYFLDVCGIEDEPSSSHFQ